MTRARAALAIAFVATLAITACGGGDDDTSADPATTSADQAPADASSEDTGAAGVRVVAPEEAAATIADAPDDLVILDVRTQEEFDEGHIEGAVMLDFYREDFAEELATFDRDVPYVLYCRSGNRSAQARQLMEDLGFSSVEDIDGGIVGWQQAGLPVVPA
jgi:rhodanese-related sulfurtransferase